MSLLDADEQDLVIELTRNFTVISGNDYLQFLIGLLNRINEDQVELFKTTNKFFVFPLLAPQDFQRIKSSTCVWYSFRSESIKYNPVFLEKDLIFCDIAKASWVDNIKPNQAVILLDDYIGSGETAISAIEWFVPRPVTSPYPFSCRACPAPGAASPSTRPAGPEWCPSSPGASCPCQNTFPVRRC